MPERHLHRSVAVAGAAVLAIAILLGGCGDGSDDDQAGAPTSTTAGGEGHQGPAAPSTTRGSRGAGGDASETTTTETTVPEGTLIEVEVADGSVRGGVERVEVAVGEQVTVRVTADTTDEVHVHGYDLFADVAPGSPGEIAFTADIPGIFEIELEQAGRQLRELEVA